MDSTPAVSRLRLSRFSQYSQRSGTDNHYLAPQAGPSRLSSYMDASDGPYSDDDEQATPRVTSMPPLNATFDATPSQTIHESGAERLRKVMAMAQDHSSMRQPPTRPPPENASDMDSDFESPHATVSESIHVQKFKDLFAKAKGEEWTPPKKRLGHRRNSIDSSEVEDSPRVERVQQEREQLKSRRKIVSDEEAEVHPKSSEAPEGSRYASTSAARFEALQDRLNSFRSSTASQEPTRSTAFPMSNVMSGAEELMELEPPTVLDASGETSGETAKMFRNMDQTPSMSGIPLASSTPMRTMQMPSHFESQSNLLGEDSAMQNAMKGLDSEGESYAGQRSRLPFPGSRPNAGEASPDAAARAHLKSHSAHKLPIPRKVSTGRESVTSSRSSSVSNADFQERYKADDADKRYERERLWNKPNGRSPGRTPESARRVSGGSPSFNTTIRPGDAGSPSRGVSRRASMTSLRHYGSRSSLGSSLSSNADDRERIEEFDDEKARERERNWNKPRPRRTSSGQSMNAPLGTPPRPGSEQAYNFLNGRAVSWHSPGRTQNLARSGSPTPSAEGDGREESHNPVVQERERNWNAAHPQWVHQIPRSMSPLPPSPPVPGSGYGRAPADWDPNYQSPSRVRHTSLVNGRKPSYERSRTSSLSDEKAPTKATLHRAVSQELRARRSQSPVFSETTEDDQHREASSRFGWAMPKRRPPLPPFQPDVETPQKRPSTPESRPSSRLGTRPSLIPIRSPGRKDDASPRPVQSAGVSERRKDKGKQRDTGDGLPPESRVYPSQRSRIEPIDLINAPTEDLVPTDIESGSDRESQVTSTPLAQPSTLPPEAGPSGSRRSPSPPLATSPEQNHSSGFPDSFVTAASVSSPQLSPVRERSPEPPFGLSTPPRRPQDISKFEFETPSPPRDMPELPGPPSSSDDEFDRQATPIRERRSLLADFTAAKTPRPPGAWAPTPVPADKPEREPANPPPASVLPPEAATPTPAAPVEPSVVAPTPAPPGAWQATPASLRRKSILKVRFDVENTSGESMPEVPMIGPGTGDPAVDSMSEMFPPLVPPPPKEQSAPPAPQPAPALVQREEPRQEERPSTPPTVRPRRFRSPSIKLVDPHGKEIVDSAEPPLTESPQDEENAQRPPSPEAMPQLRMMRPITLVDPMGRKVKQEEEEPSLMIQSADVRVKDEDFNTRPLTRRESLTRLRDAIHQMAEDFGESDDSRVISRCDDRRLEELYRKSQAAMDARRSLVENLKKRQSDPNIKPKDWLPREAVSKGRGLFAIDFLNTWVLWTFVVLQILILVYMYHLSTIRAKQIFLTTYYDAFTPDLFSHISRSHLLRNAIPPASSPSATPFNITDALTRDGWRGVAQEAWTRTTLLVAEWQHRVWDDWGQHPGRTAWPPT